MFRYLAHGTATDYMYEVLKVPMSFTWEIYGDAAASFEDCFRMFNPVTQDKFETTVSSWVSAIIKLIELLPTHPATYPLFKDVLSDTPSEDDNPVQGGLVDAPHQPIAAGQPPQQQDAGASSAAAAGDAQQAQQQQQVEQEANGVAVSQDNDQQTDQSRHSQKKSSSHRSSIKLGDGDGDADSINGMEQGGVFRITQLFPFIIGLGGLALIIIYFTK